VFALSRAGPRCGRVGFDRRLAGQANVQVDNVKRDQVTPVERLVFAAGADLRPCPRSAARGSLATSGLASPGR